jgi:hypothetical protein
MAFIYGRIIGHDVSLIIIIHNFDMTIFVGVMVWRIIVFAPFHIIIIIIIFFL